MYRKKDLLNIIYKLGPAGQLDIAQEECAELIQAISRFRKNEGKKEALHIIEKIADMQIMLNQLRILFNIKEEILQDEMDCKIDRQLKHMEGDN